MSLAATVASPDVMDLSRADVTVSTDVSAAEWNAYTASHDGASGYHQWEWRQVFERGLGLDCRYFVARRGGRIVGILPTAEVRGLLSGGALSSLPYVNYGGVLASTPAAASALIDHAASIVARERLSYLVLRHRQRMFPSLPVRSHKQTMLLELKPTADAMWAALDRKVRNQVRKGEKSQLTVVSGGEDLLDDFYAVFGRNMRDLGTPVYGRALFAEMLRTFPGHARVHAVRLNGTTIAAALSYRYRDTIEVPSASSLREHRALCPNHLMYWHIITSAIAEGVRTFDFGRSTPGDGTFHFKEQWGARPEQLSWEYILRPGHRLPELDRHDSRLGLAIAAWKHLPVGVANALGPRIASAVP